ncbi:MAG: ABC transporter ATP-binding protein, partial [Candidatus Omnitrophica bacterium]|nr:ABC transporter ATP-binding protein [Candidatus Omnitrophota bacterium]
MKVVEFKDVSEIYRIKFMLEHKVRWEDFCALKDVNFSVNEGETVGIIGENGAGKSTLLKLIAGLLMPDCGEVVVNGRVSALLDIGVAFHPELSGRENIYLNGGLFGLSKKEINSKLQQIIDFAGIGKFFDAQVKTYSQGMFMRLAFSLAIHVEPDILLIDDILAVGDREAQKRCLNKIIEFKKQGKTIILVSHDINMMSQLCERVILLKEGRIIKDDFCEKVVNLYLQSTGNKEGIAVLEKGKLRLVFNNGITHINWGDVSLTRDLGGHDSFLIPNLEQRFFSTDAEWKIQEIRDDTFVAKGSWHNFPISEVWKITIVQDNQIHWQFNMESDISIRERETMLLFIPEYREWFSLELKDKF